MYRIVCRVCAFHKQRDMYTHSTHIDTLVFCHANARIILVIFSFIIRHLLLLFILYTTAPATTRVVDRNAAAQKRHCERNEENREKTYFNFMLTKRCTISGRSFALCDNACKRPMI